MATYLLLSRIGQQLCHSLLSCLAPPDDPHAHHQLVKCIACDRGERTLHAVCTPCVLQVLGQEESATPLLSSDTIKRSVRLFLEKLQKETSNRSVLVLVESSRGEQSQQGACECLESRKNAATGHDNGEGPQTCRCGCGCCNVEEAIRAEREVIESLYDELEQERSAAASAASESMAMITRLQDDKSHLLMEGRQYKRIVEEKAFHDTKAIGILKDMLLKREAEKTELEEEIYILRKSARSAGAGGVSEDQQASTSGGERRRSSSEAETSAAIKAVEEQRFSVQERVKRLEQQLELLRGTEATAAFYNYHKKRASDQGPYTVKKDLSSSSGSRSSGNLIYQI